jgi:hypothetical protein
MDVMHQPGTVSVATVIREGFWWFA